MRQIILLFIFAYAYLLAGAQKDTALYLFMGHPRDDDRENEHVLKTVERIDYSKYVLLLLGGDLTWNTSEQLSTLEYCDNIFKLGDENTHLAIGNHDIDNVTSLLEFTNRPRYCTFNKNNITFLVLDTEITSPDFTGDQLDLIQNVTDTIHESDYLVLLHHRIVWMIGVDSLAPLMDSVASSTNKLTSTNFYDDVYPNLQKAKNNGVEVLCLAGDRTNINIVYSPEDSIQFLASGMVGTFKDENNYAILLTHNIKSGKLKWEFIALTEIDTITVSSSERENSDNIFKDLTIYPNPVKEILHIYRQTKVEQRIFIEVYDINGIKMKDLALEEGFSYMDIDFSDYSSGVYFIQIRNNHQIATRKIINLN